MILTSRWVYPTACRVELEGKMERDVASAGMLERLEDTGSDVERHSVALEILDTSEDGSVDMALLKRLLEDPSDLIRSEAADHLIVFGGAPSDYVAEVISKEESTLVYPKLWLALAASDADAFKVIAAPLISTATAPRDQAYLKAAMFAAYKYPAVLYELCAIACSDDLPGSHTAIDLLALVAHDRPGLLQGLVEDLERVSADNAEKARRVLLA
jgi:hypothetical protein